MCCWKAYELLRRPCCCPQDKATHDASSTKTETKRTKQQSAYRQHPCKKRNYPGTSYFTRISAGSVVTVATDQCVCVLPPVPVSLLFFRNALCRVLKPRYRFLRTPPISPRFPAPPPPPPFLLRLDSRISEHDWFLRIQLERAHPDYSGALAYIASLSFGEAAEQLRRRGKALVAALPEESTGVLMALCTGRYTRKPEGGGADERRSPGGGEGGEEGGGVGSGGGGGDGGVAKMAPAEDFVHLYVDEPKWLRVFLMYVLREGGRAGPTVADTLLELLLREWARQGGRGASMEAAKKQREREVMALLDNPRAGYDADHALVLVQMLNFKPGQLYLYEKVGACSQEGGV